MKVAYINTVFGIKSTGRTYAELKAFLEQKGHSVLACYGNHKSDVPNTYRIGSRVSYYIHNVMARLTGLQGYFSHFATLGLVKKLKEFDPDVIHLGNLHGNYLNLPTLFRYLKKAEKPVFLTTHDCWFMTGKCTHFIYYGCDKFETQCSNCPSRAVYPQSWFFDFSKKMFRDKKRWFTALEDITVVAVSDWMNGNTSRSFLGDRTIVTNYNWVNTEVFHDSTEEERAQTRAELGLSSNDFLVISVSTDWTKGSPRYEDVVKLLSRLEEHQKLLIIGGNEGGFPKSNKLIHIPFVSDIRKLAQYYAASDVFVHFSTADTFGKVIAEAQCCGTPALVYDTTACGEVARVGGGYAVEMRNVDAAFDVIAKLSKEPFDARREQRTMCMQKSHAIFNKESRMETLLELYENALKKD